MSEKQREHLFPALTCLCRYAIAEASVAEIDGLNILRASLLAMQRAVEGLGLSPDHALIDGNQMPGWPALPLPLSKATAKAFPSLPPPLSPSLARPVYEKTGGTASGYGWEHNVGYGTAQHLEALQRLGATCWHRESFAPVAKLKNGNTNMNVY